MFKILLRRQPTRYLDKAPQSVVSAIEKCFGDLAVEHLQFAEPLKGDLKGLRRLRLGGLRIVIEVDLDTQTIWVVHIGPRGDVYKRGGQARG